MKNYKKKPLPTNTQCNLSRTKLKPSNQKNNYLRQSLDMPNTKSRSRNSKISTFHPNLLSYRKRSIHLCLKKAKSKIRSFKNNSENFNRTVKCFPKLSLDKPSVSKNKTVKLVTCFSRPSDRCKRYHRVTRKMKASKSK